MKDVLIVTDKEQLKKFGFYKSHFNKYYYDFKEHSYITILTNGEILVSTVNPNDTEAAMLKLFEITTAGLVKKSFTDGKLFL